MTGGFYGTADFGGINATAPAGGDFFLAKYDSAGTVQWVRQNTGAAASEYGTSVAVDSVGNPKKENEKLAKARQVT